MDIDINTREDLLKWLMPNGGKNIKLYDLWSEIN